MILSIGNMRFCVNIMHPLAVNSETHNCNFGQHIALVNIIKKIYKSMYIA